MVLSQPQLLRGKVMHKRLWPRVNQFVYGIYYFTLPLEQLERINDGWRCGYNRPALVSFQDRDHGPRDGSSLLLWIKSILITHNLDCADGQVVLVCMPRVFGYVFNPVSFWLCHDQAGQLRAVLCEVNNTFGETHNYLCAHPDSRPLAETDILVARKIFHVSPFLHREGSYNFRFAPGDENWGVWIDYYSGEDKLQLVTALTGKLAPLNRVQLRHAFWTVPLVGLRALFLIHWQALKLLGKGIRYIPRPQQLAGRLSQTLQKINQPETGITPPVD